MATNVNPAVSPSIQPTARSSETKTDKIVVNRDGGSSSGFAKQTDVKFTNSVDNMSAILEKISQSELGKNSNIPQPLRDMINNVVTKAFSLENSLGEGLGSAMASERYSLEQLTSLGRIFQQLGNMAEANAMAGEISGETSASQLSDALQIMMANVKTVLANSNLGGNTANLELVQLTKLAFQILNNGNADNVPENMAQLLKLLGGEAGSNSLTENGLQQAGSKFLTNPSSQVLGNGLIGQAGQENSAVKELVDLLFPKLASGNNAGDSGQAGVNQGIIAKQAMNAYNSATANPNNAISNQGISGQNIGNNASGAQAGATVLQQGDVGQTVVNQSASGQNLAETLPGKAGNMQADGQQSQIIPGKEVQATVGKEAQVNAGGEGLTNSRGGSQVGATDGQGQNLQGGISPKALHQAAELENNPLFKQIFSRYGYSQETGVVRQPSQTVQQEISQLPNNQQVVDSFRNLAELLVKDSTLTAKDAALLKNFVNGNQAQLSEQDAKQLNLLIKMVQSNVPAAIQQAGQQQGMEGLPKLWAFLQLADLGSLKNLKAKDFKNANKEIKTVVSSMKNSINSEGSYQADGQKSISFVMPLYIGEGGHSYPAYINLYDEPEHEDECGRKRKDTWFRVCVLTDNIGAVDIVCQLFEGNNLNLRINFSAQEIVQDFGEYLPDIRKALYDTSIHLNDLRVGTVN